MNAANEVNYDEQFVDLPNEEYILQTVEIDTIINELTNDDEEAALTKSIILNLEEEAAKTIKAGLIAQLPQVGKIQRNTIKDMMQTRNKELREARKVMSKEDYKVFAKKVRKEVKDNIEEEYNKRKIVEKYKRNLKHTYTNLVINRGKLYAELYIQAILNCKSIPFDKAVQEQYDRLAGRYEE